MENEKRKMKNERRDLHGENISAVKFPPSAEKVCSACGAQARRADAKFCLVCGKLLREDYQPLDRLRASYSLRRNGAFNFTDSRKTSEEMEIENLFEENKNSASETAKAFVVYSLVPYLGILFCPGAMLLGGIGIVMAYRKPFLGGARASVLSVALGFLILAAQIFLWWLLYIIPELGGRF
jgi:hypothetical protein